MKNRKLKILLAFFALLLCITQIKETYAKYIETKEGNSDFTIANWNIKVNNQDITEATTMSSLITPIYDENENVKDGVIAPGSTGYFDLTIDASKTEVSFKYTISINTPDNAAVTDLQITGYKIDNGNIISASGAEVSDTISYNNSNKTLNIRVYFEWKDGTGETMDNSKDTSASVKGETAKLKVGLSFVQVAN